jgi:hypothetical protein
MTKSKKTSKANKAQKNQTGRSKKVAASRGQADAKAAAATQPEAKARHEATPASTDIRRRYIKSLLGDYLGKHRDADAIKPKK